MAPGRSTDPSRSLATPLRRARFILAIVVATALVLSAPFIGFVRSWIRATFPGQFVRIVGGAIAVLAAAAIVAAILRIRQNRLLRYGALLAAVAGAIWFSIVEATGNADVDVVQRFHFVEYGIITFLFYRAWRALEDPAILLLPALAGLLVGTADEWLQWFIPNRVGEIADILLNGIAIGCGLLFSVGADPPARFTWSMRPGSILRVGRLAAATVVALALFVHIVHLGDDINDREVGVFKSRYSMTALPALAAAKRAEWQMHPPPLTLQRVSREDQYMTEGVTHVQRRNELLGADQAKGAWMENLILEKYYATPRTSAPRIRIRYLRGHAVSSGSPRVLPLRPCGSPPGSPNDRSTRDPKRQRLCDRRPPFRPPFRMGSWSSDRP